MKIDYNPTHGDAADVQEASLNHHIKAHNKKLAGVVLVTKICRWLLDYTINWLLKNMTFFKIITIALPQYVPSKAGCDVHVYRSR